MDLAAAPAYLPAMRIVNDAITVETKGEADMLDLSGQVAALVRKHRLARGQALVFVAGSTAAVTTIEFEPGLRQDFPALFERLAPRGERYRHEDQWRDGNGHAHVRASLLGPSLTVPFEDGKLLTGTWQQIVLVDFDNRPRRREVVVQLLGE